jgi:hypothetical protein
MNNPIRILVIAGGSPIATMTTELERRRPGHTDKNKARRDTSPSKKRVAHPPVTKQKARSRQ